MPPLLTPHTSSLARRPLTPAGDVMLLCRLVLTQILTTHSVLAAFGSIVRLCVFVSLCVRIFSFFLRFKPPRWTAIVERNIAMPGVLLFSKTYCSFCAKLKALLRHLRIPFRTEVRKTNLGDVLKS